MECLTIRLGRWGIVNPPRPAPMGRVGIEPTTLGLKVRLERAQLLAETCCNGEDSAL